MDDLAEQIAAEAEKAESEGHTLTGERLRELVEAEASAAEAEPEPEDEEETEMHPEPMPDDPLTAALAEYVGRIMDILGPDAPIRPCGYCQGKGFNPVELREDAKSHVCENCDGFGEVITGSKVSGNEARQCQDCKGSGYIADQPETNVTVNVPGESPVQVLSEDEVAEIVRKAQEQANANVG